MNAPAISPQPFLAMWRGSTLFVCSPGETDRCAAFDFAEDGRFTVTVFNGDNSELFDIPSPAAGRLAEALADCLPTGE